MNQQTDNIAKLKNFIKKETILTIALLLAVISMFITPPCEAYAGYIDYNTLLLLFSLMAVVAGFRKLGVFSWIGKSMLSKIRSTRQLMLVLVFLPFFFSMLITNDVALITFVPLAIIILRMSGQEQLLLPLVTLQTLAANLGSMLMPMGNPQNLYLFTRSGLGLDDFLRLMLPLYLLSAVLLFIAVMLIKSQPLSAIPSDNVTDSEDGSRITEPDDNKNISNSASRQRPSGRTAIIFICYMILLILCILSVLKILAPLYLTGIICVFLLFADRGIFKKVDYSLLLTFIGFFVFIGNISQIASFRAALQSLITGHEIPVAILSSQIISNVPAALLLSGFTTQYSALIIGTNLGGLGTLIASMASLISYKQIAKEYSEKRAPYLGLFTLANIIMLGILYGAFLLMPQ